MLMLLVRTNTIRATNQMSEKNAGSCLHFSIDTQTYLLRKTSKVRLPLPVVNLDKASVCGDQKTSFSFWQKRKNQNSYISGVLVCRAWLVFGGPISVGPNDNGSDHMYGWQQWQCACTNLPPKWSCEHVHKGWMILMTRPWVEACSDSGPVQLKL